MKKRAYPRALGCDPGEMLLFTVRRARLVRLDLAELFDVNELVVGRVGQGDDHVRLERGVIEQGDPDADLFALAAGARHLDVHVERPVAGELAGGPDEAEAVLGAHGERRDDPVGGDLGDRYGEDVVAVRADVDVLPEPRVLVHAQEAVDSRETVAGELAALLGRAAGLVGAVLAVERPVAALLRPVADARHARQVAERGVAVLAPVDHVRVGEHDERGVLERPVRVDAVRRRRVADDRVGVALARRPVKAVRPVQRVVERVHLREDLRVAQLVAGLQFKRKRLFHRRQKPLKTRVIKTILKC